MRTSLQKAAVAAVLCCQIAFFVGCENEFDRLAEENQATVAARKSQIDQALKKVSQLPHASNGYQEWVAAKEQVKTLALYMNSSGMSKEMRDQLSERITEAQEKAAEAFAEIDVANVPKEVSFADDSRNAATLFLSEEDVHSANFRDRNWLGAAWFSDGPPVTTVEEAEEWYNLHSDLKYLLVVRQLDIAVPEFEGRDDSDQCKFTLGAIECDATLVELESSKKLMSFRFVMPGQRPPLSFGEMALFLPNDPEDGVKSLTENLYSSAHDFSHAIASELSEHVISNYIVQRDLLGTRIEDRTSLR